MVLSRFSLEFIMLFLLWLMLLRLFLWFMLFSMSLGLILLRMFLWLGLFSTLNKLALSGVECVLASLLLAELALIRIVLQATVYSVFRARLKDRDRLRC